MTLRILTFLILATLTFGCKDDSSVSVSQKNPGTPDDFEEVKLPKSPGDTLDPGDVADEDDLEGDAPNGAVEHLLALPTGDYIAFGEFSSVGSHSAPGIAKFGSDGKVDTQFLSHLSQFSGRVHGARALQDGTVAIFGEDLRWNGSKGSSVLFLKIDGQLDQAKMDELNKDGGLTGQVFDLKEDATGRLHLVGHLPKLYDDDPLNYATLGKSGVIVPPFDEPGDADTDLEDEVSTEDGVDLPLADDEEDYSGGSRAPASSDETGEDPEETADQGEAKEEEEEAEADPAGSDKDSKAERRRARKEAKAKRKAQREAKRKAKLEREAKRKAKKEAKRKKREDREKANKEARRAQREAKRKARRQAKEAEERKPTSDADSDLGESE